MQNRIKLLIVDDHKMIREGICSMLESHNSKCKFIIEEAGSGEEGIEKIMQSAYDIVLMDYKLSKLNGAETTRRMLSHRPLIKILAMSNYDETAYIRNMIQAGVKGYVLKDLDADELFKAMNVIKAGKNYYSNDVAVKLLSDGGKTRLSTVTPSGEKLSARERQVLLFIADAYTNKQIATKLCLSSRTVDKYRQHLLEKMNVSNTTGLLKIAREYKFIT